MFFDASLASSAFPSEKQGAPRGIPLSILSKEKARQGLLARLSLVRSISLLDIRFPCSNVKNPAWFYGGFRCLSRGKFDEKPFNGRSMFPRRLFQNFSGRTLLFSLFRCDASRRHRWSLESFANLGQYVYVTSVQMIDISYEILRARCWTDKICDEN